MKLYDTTCPDKIAIVQCGGMKQKLAIRNCNPRNTQDCGAYERLKKGAVFAHLLSRPGYEVSKNLFFAEAEGVIVGYINVLPEPGIGRTILEYGLSPQYSRKAVLISLFDRALERARELGAEVAHVNIPASEPVEARFLSNLGFKPVRRFYEMSLDFRGIELEAIVKRGLVYRSLKAGEEGLLALIENRCFSGTWGFNPETDEYIAWELGVRGGCYDDVILALSGERVIGYCWTQVECGCEPATGRRRGRICMLGVEPDYRGRGIGREVIKAGLWHLKDKGRDIVDITVDSQNAPAVNLYYSLGFQTQAVTVWYEKAVA